MVLNGKYRVQGVVATGGMGRIYRAEQIPLGRPVAVKVLNTRYTSSDQDPAFQKRFFLEASILSRLQHPNVVTVFDYGRIEDFADEAYFMAMEYLPGETLHKRLRARGALSPTECIAIVRQIARGLREAHRQGVVHRDLKPSNIMLAPDEDGSEHVKILDFGLVKVLHDDSEELTREGSFLGSPRYMSPEQIAHGKVDHRTDLYSLGVILYQCLCGRTPFESENSVQILMAHLQHPVPPLSEKNPTVTVPPMLEALVYRCLDKQPEGRPGSCDELLHALRECEREIAGGDLPPGTGSFVGPRPPAFGDASSSISRAAIHGSGSAMVPADPSLEYTTGSQVVPPRGRRSVTLLAGALVLMLGVGIGVVVLRSLRPRPTAPLADTSSNVVTATVRPTAPTVPGPPTADADSAQTAVVETPPLPEAQVSIPSRPIAPRVPRRAPRLPPVRPPIDDIRLNR